MKDRTGARPSPMRHALPIALGLAVGSGLYFGYQTWSHGAAQQRALAAAPGDPDLAKPAPEECQIARTALAAIHAAGSDQAWRKGAEVSRMTLATASKVVNPVDAPAITDDEADDLRGKAPADWRWCPDMGAFVGGLGWRAMGGDEAVGELALGRPALNKTRDEARIYEAFLAPDADTGALRLSRGPWLATLRRGPDGGWRVASTDDLKRRQP